jgi:hypothetical protein
MGCISILYRSNWKFEMESCGLKGIMDRNKIRGKLIISILLMIKIRKNGKLVKIRIFEIII